MINLTIDGKNYKGEKGENLLQVGLNNGFDIPHLCYHENLSPYGGCRLCLIEVTRGERTTLTTSCTYPGEEGLQVKTSTPQVLKARRLMMEIILALAPSSSHIQSLAGKMGVERTPFNYQKEGEGCIKCGLCVRACEELVGAGVLTFSHKGPQRKVEPPFGEEPKNCIGCGTCVYVCPAGCLTMEDTPQERKIDRWKRRMEMKTCQKCHQPYMPTPQIEYILKGPPDPPPEKWLSCCPICRREG